MNRQSRLKDRHASFISTSQACELLNIKLATLYTYVSRGLIFRIPTGRKRQSRYSLTERPCYPPVWEFPERRPAVYSW